MKTVDARVSGTSPTRRASFDASAFHAAIDTERRARGLTSRQVAEQAKISASTLTRLAQGHRPDVDSLAALLDWSGLSADLFITRTRAVAAPDTPAVIAGVLRADRNLSPRSAQALAVVVRVTYDALREAGPRSAP